MTTRRAIFSALACIALVAPAGAMVAPARTMAGAKIARFGAFAVISEDRARLVGVTDSSSPADFLALIEAHPGLHTLELVDCPGTRDDIANLRLGRMIRERRIATVAPAGASVRSGAVDIFLAGSPRVAASDARFAVHSWLSVDGREAGTARSSEPARIAYERYYRDMGLTDADARAFYALTISAPNSRPLQLAPRELARFARVALTT